METKQKPLCVLIQFMDGREVIVENVHSYQFKSEYLHVTLNNEPENVLFAPYKNINFVVGRQKKQDLLDIISSTPKTKASS